MPKQYVIGIDIGTSGCKTLIIDGNGQVVARALEEYPLSTPQPGWSEQDPEHWWQAVKSTLKQSVGTFDHVADIKAIGLSGQMHGLVALDKDCRVLRPAILWNDQRTGPQCQEIHDLAGGVEGLLKLTNNRMLPGYTGGKIIWLRQNEPQLYEKLNIILNPKDYIRYRLTGEFATEVSDASGTGLFNVRQRQWSRELLDLLEIPMDWLPRCYESPEISGQLSGEVAADLGLPAGLAVAGGGGDSVIQTTGTGLVEPGILGTTIGTAGIVAMALDKCYDNPDGRLQVFCNNTPHRWHTMGVTLAAGGSLRWIRDMLGGAENEVARWLGEDVYELFSREAAAIEPGSDGLLFMPYLIGERCPYPDPNARGGFIGLTLRHDRRSILRSVLEGVIFSMRDVARLITDMGLPITQIRTSGGGALSDLWRQIHADVFNSEVITVSGSAEGGAYGAALVAGTGVGMWSSVEEAVQVVRAETHNMPIAENFEIYNKLFPIYRELYDALKVSFDKIADIYA
ncbi:Xylulose kinase (EC [Olavius sp. associated proteobacterium Delta 1]|nr:Xylulose kinase (EC [Olavius sp. associated proteobacterium Delta 1]